MKHYSEMKQWTGEELDNNEELYIKNGGIKCPFCKSDDIVGDDISIDLEDASQEMGCLECEAAWHDIYKLKRINIMKTPQKYDVALIRLRNSLNLPKSNKF